MFSVDRRHRERKNGLVYLTSIDLLFVRIMPIIFDHHDMLHVILCTRPSCFSVCNIEKLGMGLGTRLGQNQSLYPLCMVRELLSMQIITM